MPSSASYSRLNAHPPSVFTLIFSYLRSLPRSAYITTALIVCGSLSFYAFTCSGEQGCRIGWGKEVGSTSGSGGWSQNQLDALRWSQDGEGKDGHPIWTQIRDTWEEESVLTPLHSNTTGPPFTACVVWLLSVERIFQMAASLESLARHVPFTHPYPLIFLHEGDFDDPLMQSAFLERWYDRVDTVRRNGENKVADKMNAFGKLIEFVPVDLTPPAEMAVLGKEGLNPISAYAWPGYHSMCRFFATAVFDHPRLRNLDYYMRMDTDSYITSSMAVDPFVTMHTRSKVYGFRNRGTDPEDVTQGMWEFLETYLAKHPALEDKARKNNLVHEKYGDRFPMMNNNFELVHIPSFKTEEVKDWLVHVRAQSLRFYKFRWGDAPIRAATIDIFFDAEQLIELCDFSYFHHDIVPKSCDLPPLQ